jgi:hypothetical protein
MKTFLLLIFLGTSFWVSSQTVIEMMYPGDANLVLLEVENPDSADIVVYRTNDKKQAVQWDLMWKFKKWGFCNFSVYITKDPDDSLLIDEETGIRYPIQGRIYFTNNPEERGYKTPGFHLEGIFKKVKTRKDDNDGQAKDEENK